MRLRYFTSVMIHQYNIFCSYFFCYRCPSSEYIQGRIYHVGWNKQIYWKLTVFRLLKLGWSMRVSSWETIMKLLDLMQDSRATGRIHQRYLQGKKYIQSLPPSKTSKYKFYCENVQEVSAIFCTCTHNGWDDRQCEMAWRIYRRSSQRKISLNYVVWKHMGGKKKKKKETRLETGALVILQSNSGNRPGSYL